VAIVLAPVADKNRFDEVAEVATAQQDAVNDAIARYDLNVILGIAGIIEVAVKRVSEFTGKAPI